MLLPRSQEASGAINAISPDGGIGPPQGSAFPLEPRQFPSQTGREPLQPYPMQVRQLTLASCGLRYPKHVSWIGATAWRSQMTAIAKALSRAFVTVNDVEILKQLLLFCLAGLFVS